MLDVLYKNNMMHGDLHSGNVLYKMVDGSIEFKLIDFADSGELGTCAKTYSIRDDNGCFNVD
jgi:predicted unusual protein kinase regulating ubiquinone biosynthesis (AarF/ABC1/UbiB family)